MNSLPLQPIEKFWSEQARALEWTKPFTKVQNTIFDTENVSIKWFEDGELNVCANCVDRHLPERADQIALIWEGDNPADTKKITYHDLHINVQKLANVYKSMGAEKGDRIVIYMPMILEGVYAMLAAARLGLVHSVVFGGFSAEALADRIRDCQPKFIITANEGIRGGRTVPLKSNIDKARELLEDHRDLPAIVVQRTKTVTSMNNSDVWYHEIASTVPDTCAPASVEAEHPLFILYTSGSTGKPKGVVHSTGGYLLYTAYTQAMVFGLQEGDVYWCTADIGWITGHSYMVYGPLANGTTSIIFEGTPTHPSASRFWQVCERHKVNIFYTAPTAIRALMSRGNKPVEKHDLSSLRVLGTVGEPINPEAWRWFHDVVGKKRCAVVDTWWQTETGGIMISTTADSKSAEKPGCATRPLAGVKPVVMDNTGELIEKTEAEGVLCIADSWPGQMRTVYNDHQRFVDTYFKPYPGYYFTGDGCRRDSNGDYWITGRVDDVLNVSGHRLGTAEIESALVAHEAVSEAAVVGFSHPVKGEAIFAFVTLMKDVESSTSLRKELVHYVRDSIGAIATPEKIQFSPDLPKTRSGKIMRRILRKIAENRPDDIGDVSTLANPEVVKHLIKERAYTQ